ncbi:MAG: energy-coupling factor transporter transmembrane protein EcfT [Clostridiales bacterium]|nr:energy-coupling factor transporter transmembrane protein EcfT [Clostridiales bacterium]
MRDVSMGQYYPTKSIIHRLDARIKLLLVIAYIVMLFFIPTVDNYLAKGGNLSDYVIKASCAFIVVILFFIVSVLLSKVPMGKVLKSIKGVIYLVIITAVIMLLFYSGSASHVYFQRGIISVSLEGIISAAVMALRLFLLVIGPSLLTLTTTSVELTDGLERLLKPLALIKVPVHDIAIIMSIALRLIPTLIEEADKITAAQKARLAEFDDGNVFKRVKAMLPVFVPLLVSSFRRADELAYAMDSRCYSGAKGRTRMKVMRLSLKDFVAMLVMAAVFFAVLMFVYDYFGLVPLLVNLVGIAL